MSSDNNKTCWTGEDFLKKTGDGISDGLFIGVLFDGVGIGPGVLVGAGAGAIRWISDNVFDALHHNCGGEEHLPPIAITLEKK